MTSMRSHNPWQWAAVLLAFLQFATDIAAGRSIHHKRQAVGSNSSGIGQPKIALIKQTLQRTATESWEVGTHTQALLEWDYPELSVFREGSIPPPSTPVATEVLSIASSVLTNKSANSLQLMPDGSASDPASIGVAVLLANWTRQSTDRITSAQYLQAATQQVRSLLQEAPRTGDGAISHRLDQTQLWSDFVYMAPPFLAYYGVLTANATIIQIAYDQCRLYRNNLRQSNGLWLHIVQGTNPDLKLWATGNAWAASGMLRVSATISHSTFADAFASQVTDLNNWSNEIATASFALQQPGGFFPNYFNRTSTFTDASSAALMAAVSYRLAYLDISATTLPQAEITRQAIYRAVNPTTGILTPVVDPLSYANEGTQSPEGQAFVLIMEASWRDWFEKTNGRGSTSEAQGGAIPSAALGTSWLLALGTAVCLGLSLVA